MLENNTFRVMMAILATIVGALLIHMIVSNHNEIMEVISEIMSKRVTKY